MNIPGHTGLTLGSFFVAGYLGDALLAHSVKMSPSSAGWSGRLGSALQFPPRLLQRLGIDYRVIFVGSLLPDVVDKPLGILLLPQLLELNSRTIGHTLAFNFALLVTGLLLLTLKHTYTPIVLAVSSAGHLVLDQMWQAPQTLLWPFLGWRFPLGLSSLDEWLMFQLTAQWLAIPEVIGLLVLVWFASQAYRRRTILRFLKTGAIERHS
jgi:hypothetical protein